MSAGSEAAEFGRQTAPWLFQVAGPIIWLALLTFYIVDAKRQGRWKFGAVLLVAATTMWWQEWYGD